MELQGSGYFYTLAQLSMAFVGFGAIVIALRQSTGKSFSEFHVFLTRVFIESGLMATAFAMLGSTLALTGIKEVLVWRIASTIMFVVLLPWVIAYPIRRKIALTSKAPLRVYAMFFLGLAAAAALALNATGWLIDPNPFPLALATIYVLVFATVAFLFTYTLFLRD